MHTILCEVVISPCRADQDTKWIIHDKKIVQVLVQSFSIKDYSPKHKIKNELNILFQDSLFMGVKGGIPPYS